MGRVGAMHGNAMGVMMPGLMGMMGVMSLVEAYRIHTLKQEQRLHTHPLFKTARSWDTRHNDSLGGFNRINQTDLDDPVERQGHQPICCFCPCWTNASSGDEDETEMVRRQPITNVVPPPPAALGGRQASSDDPQRARREAFLANVEGQQAHRAKTVRQLEEERNGARGDSSW